ncbi:MAG: DHHW family protein [Eubacteriales bacterium]|nr:DHHW family protein [Eubacteriales bacterium]
MNRNIKNIIVTICFIAIIAGFMLANLVMADAEFSVSERRKLKQVPSYSTKKLLSGEYFEELEKYTLDQFAMRESLRSLAAYTRYYALIQKDNNGIYIVNRNNINEINYPLNEKSVLNAAKKFNEIYQKYFTGKNMKVYYSVIPDKNYFVAAQNGYPAFDYEKLQEILAENIDDMKYIDILDHLGIEDFYRTDIHWRQEKIIDVADKLLAEMGSKQAASGKDYEEIKMSPFLGSYYRQAALKIEPDELIYLTNKSIENAEVYDYALKTYGKVYSPEKFQGVDSYDVFLSGPVPLITVSNSSCTTGKELILFRDSFGSSIAPLLISSYSKITLVDLRYIATDHIGQYIDFTQNQDVLFLYNTQILNNSYMLK